MARVEKPAVVLFFAMMIACLCIKSSRSAKLLQIIERILREISLGGIRNDGADALAWTKPRSDLECCNNGSAGTGAAEYTFFNGKTTHHVERFFVVDGDDLVRQRKVGSLRQEACSNSFDGVIACLASAVNGAFAFDQDRFCAGAAFLNRARNSRKGAARACADTNGVNAAFHLLDDFLPSCFVVDVRIAHVLELSGEPMVRGRRREFPCATNRLFHSLFGWRANDASAEGLHEHDFLFREFFGNEEYDLISALHSDEGEPYSGVSGGGLH